MRRVFLSDEREERIHEARGDTPFASWVAEAVDERLMRDRIIDGLMGDGPLDDLYIAVVEAEEVEAVLLWRCHLPAVGDVMLPIMARTVEAMDDWSEMIALELNMMDGPPVRWRRWDGDGAEQLDYLRAPAVGERD